MSAIFGENNMANDGHDNLIPFNRRTEDEQREITRKGGTASGVARRKKKKMKEVLAFLLHDAEIPEAIRENLKAQGIREEDYTHLMVMTRSLVSKAETGDVSAYNAIAAMMGEKPKEEIEHRMTGGIEIGFVDSGHAPVGSEEEIDGV